MEIYAPGLEFMLYGLGDELLEGHASERSDSFGRLEELVRKVYRGAHINIKAYLCFLVNRANASTRSTPFELLRSAFVATRIFHGIDVKDRCVRALVLRYCK